MPRWQIHVISRIHRIDPDERRAGVRFGPVPVEQLERVGRGDVRQRRHHEHVGEEDRPAVEPARAGPNARVVQANVVPASGSALFR